MPAMLPGTLNYNTAQPVIPPMKPVAPFVPPNAGTFGTPAPTPTPYGSFVPPDPTAVGNDPEVQWRIAQGAKALDRSAARRGTMLTGGAGAALLDYGRHAAAAEYGDVFKRDLTTYNANRDTNAQNFGQSLGSYGADLNAFQANSAAGLGYGHLGLDASQAAYGQARDAYHDSSDQAMRDTAMGSPTVSPQQPMDDWLAAQARARSIVQPAAQLPTAPRPFMPGDGPLPTMRRR